MKSRPIGVESILATDQNTRRDDARGGSFLLAHQQLGALALGTAPTNGQVVNFIMNGTTIPFTAVTGTPTNPGDVKAPGTALGFVTNLIAAARRPDLTTSTFIALSAPNQQLMQYVGFAWPGSSTSIVPFSLNKNVNGAPSSLTSFNITTTVTSGTWTAQTMQLYIEEGTYFVNGSRLLYTGGSTPTVTAPVSNPRIDVLTIDGSGTLAWTTGTENASPVAPTYPANKIPICELYNVVSETALYDTENQQASQGYILNDVRPTLNYGANFGAFAADIIPDTTNTRSLGTGAKQWLNIYGENLYSNGSLVAAARFGGTGADGALNVTSGTTTINLGGLAVFIKNYTSINISVGATVNFTNPNTNGTSILLKSQGNITIAGTLDATGTGNQNPGTGGTPSGGAGTAGAGPSNVFDSLSTHGGQGGGSSGGAGGIQYTFPFLYHTQANKSIFMAPGSSGGGGKAGTNGTGSGAAGGAGGVGAGSIYLECAGTYTATGTVTVAGTTASNGANQSGGGNGGGGGGGGGGAAGIFYCIYNILGTDSATYTTTGGSGGSGGSGNNTNGAVGGNGGGGGANSDNAGTVGTQNVGGSGSGVSGGAGAAGVAIRELNVTWA